jgi:hypothetical protein
LNGTIITGATNQTYNPSVSGVYRVDVANPSSGCVSSSVDFNYVLSAIKPSDAAEIGLNVYPIPANNILNLSFEVLKKENVSINLTNLIGQEAYTTKKDNFTGKYAEGIDLSNFNDGVYILQVKIGEKFYTQKITVVK